MPMRRGPAALGHSGACLRHSGPGRARPTCWTAPTAIPAPASVIPVPVSVIPAQAGIQVLETRPLVPSPCG